jgi:hypothetical protein
MYLIVDPYQELILWLKQLFIKRLQMQQKIREQLYQLIIYRILHI